MRRHALPFSFATLAFTLTLNCALSAQIQPQPTPPNPPDATASTPAQMPQKQTGVDDGFPPGAHPLETPINTDRPLVVGQLNGISTNTHADLGEPITVCIRGLRHWSEQTGHDYHKLRLFLAGNVLPTSQPTLVSLDQEYVNFFLNPKTSDPTERDSWFKILQEARRHDEGSIPISVGSVDGLQPFASEQFIKLRVYPKYTPAIVIFLAILFVALIYLGYKSSLLRDGRIVDGVKPPYSLGRTQMAWWFYLVIASYLYLWLITGQVNMLTASVLVLIGISAGTGLSAIFIDQQKLSSQLDQRAKLAIQQVALQARIAQLHAAAPVTGSPLDTELQTKATELTIVNASVAALPMLPPRPVSQGLIDILRDGDGISFHRFQIVVWTLVFGAVFVRAVLKDLIMPEFDSTLLGLMGLSSGTYVGFKFPEVPK